MKTVNKLIGASMSLILFSSLLAAPAQAGSRAIDTVSAEVARVKGVLLTLKLSDDETKALQDLLNQAEEALQSGHLYYGLFVLHAARGNVLSFEYRKLHAEIEKGGIAAFEQQWRLLGKKVAKDEQLIERKLSQARPLIVKALIERALTQVGPYYQSGRLYGLNTTVSNGLFYLGQVEANLSAALFNESLVINETKPAIKLRSLEPELKRLESEILESYRKPGAAERQLLYNRVNSTLKVAWELNAERRYAGALLQYLSAARFLLLIIPPAPDSLDPLKAQGELWRAKLASENRDHSIGQMLLEMARFAIDRAEKSSDKEASAQAAVVLNHVLPRYFDYTTGVKQ